MTTIQCQGMGNPFFRGPVGQYLMSYDNKTGESEWTHDRMKALLFETKMDAWAFWGQTLESDPVRPDGQPNRPLTAFTVMIEEVTD